MRGRWQLTTTAGSMQASPSLTLVVWFAIAIVGGGRRIQLASRGGVETSPNACRGPRQNYRFGAIAPGTILSTGVVKILFVVVTRKKEGQSDQKRREGPSLTFAPSERSRFKCLSVAPIPFGQVAAML